MATTSLMDYARLHEAMQIQNQAQDRLNRQMADWKHLYDSPFGTPLTAKTKKVVNRQDPEAEKPNQLLLLLEE